MTQARASPPSSCCRSTITSTTATSWRRAWSTTGATTRWASSRPTIATPAATRSASSRRWSRPLHSAGIEVILDVVYNHTAEGNHLGPTLAMKGIDNASYYMLSPEDRRYYMDFTGCGNVPNMSHPRVLQLIMDSLRYWVTEMHVDGFRFDLASTLARELHEINRLGTFFDIIHQDPIDLAGQADRRALGRRPRRLSGRQLPGPLDRVERQVPRHRPALLEGGRRARQRVRHPVQRLQRPLPGRRPQALRQHQLRHLPRRLHAPRPRQLQREAQRGQRRGQPRRRRRQPELELRRRGADRRPRDHRPPRAPEAEPDGHAAALAGRADDLRRRRAEPHPEGEQQRLLPGQRHHLVRLGPRRARRSSSSTSSPS